VPLKIKRQSTGEDLGRFLQKPNENLFDVELPSVPTSTTNDLPTIPGSPSSNNSSTSDSSASSESDADEEFPPAELEDDEPVSSAAKDNIILLPLNSMDSGDETDNEESHSPGDINVE
jgi:hypothetical protein